MELRVSGNNPRLLEEGTAPPPPANVDTVEELEPPHVYWTPDKAQHVVAQICRAGSKFYGPSVKAAEWELELIGDPAAAVLNDWMRLRIGASSDKTANLIALFVVVLILVMLRLPDILEVHGVIKPWKPKGEQPAVRASAEVAPTPPPTPPTTPAPTAFEPQLVGNNGAPAHDDKLRNDVFSSTVVGGSGTLAAER